MIFISFSIEEINGDVGNPVENPENESRNLLVTIKVYESDDH